ncbi:TetR/AcrR family transcriptional regulator [Marinitenerispora sediminis]|uniref:TetR family transcriptional regulator n=1 Tax=Marinitenerispora sediminis TaxID=1931232 RepID=A0A368T286_9ACTN|nr:TetR family transcriptional regulator C-terminal domain-containing protein [Marinitenerispora sediminis]RCV48979.1 TetR family transcriptional regulator [Marinitenerispora sediminis]RCV49594.1 TetR family transcriptional regulator [Marinitenerispora sediminis]RCV55335.1 TetR family transcriptional regulator [Marinitenerispora sediminis]
MPARIDPEQRRGHVVEAAFRLVVAEGIDGLSLRKVAAESGLNIGSVRHYFDGHEDLLAAAAEEAGDRMGRRLARRPVEGLRGLTGAAALDALQALVEEVLPVDDERRAESIVVLELILAARTRPVFRPISERMAADLGQVVLDALAALGVRDPEAGAAQITALIGGLTLDTVTPHGSLSVEQLRATLRAHLGTLLSRDREE